MSLQKAIEILEKERIEIALEVKRDKVSTSFEYGLGHAISILKYYAGFSYKSPETQYKRDLTAWIERQRYKRHWGRDKYVSTWVETNTTIRENNQSLKEIGKVLKENGVYDPISFEEGEG